MNYFLASFFKILFLLSFPSAINDDRVDWTNPMKINQMFQVTPLKRWAFIYPKRCARESEEFLNLMKQVANGMHYDMADPKSVEMPDDRTPTYVAHIEQVMSKDPKLIMIVVPNNAGDRYAAIKKLTCVNRAIPTQVIVSKTMMPKKGNMGGVKSIATKVMIQINCKLGGAPWMINFPLKGTMTIGFDVTHDTRDKSRSFGAFVATMDLKKQVAFFSAATPHKDGNECSTNIELQMVAAIKQFKNLHDALPERIFFYRDGVGDGQIHEVHTQEVTRLQDKLVALYNRFAEGRAPKFTFIIVNKRLNTRIFVNQGSRVANPVSGTVVDNTITLPER
jgi:aubergine